MRYILEALPEFRFSRFGDHSHTHSLPNKKVMFKKKKFSKFNTPFYTQPYLSLFQHTAVANHDATPLPVRVQSFLVESGGGVNISRSEKMSGERKISVFPKKREKGSRGVSTMDVRRYVTTYIHTYKDE